MTDATYHKGTVRARCPGCGGVRSAFTGENAVVVEGNPTLQGRTFRRTIYLLKVCGGCGRGGLATVLDDGKVADGIFW